MRPTAVFHCSNAEVLLLDLFGEIAHAIIERGDLSIIGGGIELQTEFHLAALRILVEHHFTDYSAFDQALSFICNVA